MTAKYSIIVPSYNEGLNIPLNLNRYQEVIQRPDIELIIVDNGSTDDSAQVLSDLLPAYPFARSVKVEVNQGYGYGILCGLRAAHGEFLGWTHMDMQTDPGDVIQAIELLEAQKDPKTVFLKGRRRNRPFVDLFFATGMSCFESVLFGKSLIDINAQPNLFHRSFFEELKTPPHDFSLDLYALVMARKKRKHLLRFDVAFPDRIHGISHWNATMKSKFTGIKKSIKYSFQLRASLL
jgi:polyisoprenyl-phosphate glycosyltransferase